MEDLLPLLIGVIWLAFTLYNRGQKKKAAKSSGEKVSAPREPSILEQILMGQEVKVPDPEPYSEEESFDEYEPEPAPIRIEKRREAVRNAFLSEELAGITEEGEQAFEYGVGEDELIEIKDLYDAQSESVWDEDFNLRKAIIYEAVLNPPYIDFK
ncbi:MAG: hypothetical protein KQI35_13330 [Bacteroidetes bacterium]|nr:hypothetical protein [Bacteroidota bacterium]